MEIIEFMTSIVTSQEFETVCKMFGLFRAGHYIYKLFNQKKDKTN